LIEVRNKLAGAKVRCVCCVVSFPKFHYNDLLPTCCGLISDIFTRQDSLQCRRQGHNKLATSPSTGKRV